MNKQINIISNTPQRFFVSDTHFGHYNIIKHCNRPWAAEEHDDALVDLWNSVVGKKDIVYHLGDFAMFKAIKGAENRMKTYRKLRMRLNGKIQLVLGNHDKMSEKTYECFTEVHTGLKDIIVDRQKVTLCHYPMRSWKDSFHGSWQLFGHVHGRMQGVETGLSLDVGVDVPEWDYKPVSWDQIKAAMEPKKATWEINKAKYTSRG